MCVEKYLLPTEFIDSGDSLIIDFAESVIGHVEDPKQQAMKLYYAVRDGFRYDPYRIEFTPEGLKASKVLTQGYGYCVSKAILLAAVGRAVGIPTRLGFADVRNHLSSKKLKAVMQSDVFAWHGYTEFYLNNRWVKATPAFNKLLCEKTHIKPLEFDGVNDSVFHEFDQAGHKHMEYLKDHGSFSDLPYKSILDAYKQQYPVFMQGIDQVAEVDIKGAFDDEASTK